MTLSGLLLMVRTRNRVISVFDVMESGSAQEIRYKATTLGRLALSGPGNRRNIDTTTGCGPISTSSSSRSAPSSSKSLDLSKNGYCGWHVFVGGPAKPWRT